MCVCVCVTYTQTHTNSTLIFNPRLTRPAPGMLLRAADSDLIWTKPALLSQIMALFVSPLSHKLRYFSQLTKPLYGGALYTRQEALQRYVVYICMCVCVVCVCGSVICVGHAIVYVSMCVGVCMCVSVFACVCVCLTTEGCVRSASSVKSPKAKACAYYAAWSSLIW